LRRPIVLILERRRPVGSSFVPARRVAAVVPVVVVVVAIGMHGLEMTDADTDERLTPDPVFNF
jgi:hypothetical protein